MVRYLVASLCLLVFLAVQTCADAKTVCQTASNCRCGEQCVQANGGKLCGPRGIGCTCQPGCNALGLFIPRAVRGMFVYGNWCSCLENGLIYRNPYTGTPACTKARWTGFPAGTSVFEPNPRCRL